MGVFDRFLDIMKLNDDDYDEDEDDEFYDDYDDDYEDEPQQRHSFFGSRRSNRNEEDDYDYSENANTNSSSNNNNKVTPMRQPVANKRSSGNMEVCVVKPSSVDDSREITETLLAGRTVILNLEGMDLEVAQRIIDFVSGATYSISGNLQKISNYIFLVTPNHVDISGDLQDLLGSSIEQSSVPNRYS